MKTKELSVAQIGNSRGVRLPSDTLHRYGIGTVILMEERTDGILLHPKCTTGNKLSWENTAQEMAADQENWSELDYTAGDGIDNLVWKPEPTLVREHKNIYKTRSRKRRKSAVRGSL